MIKYQPLKSTNKGFTLFESLLVLFIVSFLAIGLSGAVGHTFQSVQEKVFLWEFEHLYKESQQLAITSQQNVHLQVSNQKLTNGYQMVQVPKNVVIEQESELTFNQEGGNSSLAKIRFQFPEKTVTYQLYIGSGRYKKTEE